MKSDDDVNVTRQRHRHAVARSNSEVREGARGPRGERIELRVGHTLRAPDEKLAIGVFRKRAVENAGDRPRPTGNPCVCARPLKVAECLRDFGVEHGRF